MTTQTALLNSSHHDLLTSIAFSPLSPHLLATSSLDAHIRIHSRSEESSSDDASSGWKEVDSFRAHDGPVLVIRWGEGEWGDLLASGGSDGSVRVWERSGPSNQAGGQPRWQQKAFLVEARGSVRDLAFAPADLGLRLGTIAADHGLRIYDCPNPSEGFSSSAGTSSGGLSNWTTLDSIDLSSLPLSACSSASLANASAGSSSLTSSGISLAGASLSGIAGVSSSAGKSSLGATAASGPSIPNSVGSSVGAPPRMNGAMESEGGWSLSWCKETWWGACLAVASGSIGVIRIFQFSAPSHWTQPLILFPPSSSIRGASGVSLLPSPISSLDWAPGGGRSYQLIAAGSRDGVVRIWKIWPPEANAPGLIHSDGWKAEVAAELTQHAGGGGVGKVEWNLTGTILSTAGDDGKVRLWKATYAGEWRQAAIISGEEDDSTTAQKNDVDGMAVDGRHRDSLRS